MGAEGTICSAWLGAVRPGSGQVTLAGSRPGDGSNHTPTAGGLLTQEQVSSGRKENTLQVQTFIVFWLNKQKNTKLNEAIQGITNAGFASLFPEASDK